MDKQDQILELLKDIHERLLNIENQAVLIHNQSHHLNTICKGRKYSELKLGDHTMKVVEDPELPDDTIMLTNDPLQQIDMFPGPKISMYPELEKSLEKYSNTRIVDDSKPGEVTIDLAMPEELYRNPQGDTIEWKDIFKAGDDTEPGHNHD